MSEWFKEPVLKTGDPARDRGFESHSLRHLLSFEKESKLRKLSFRTIPLLPAPFSFPKKAEGRFLEALKGLENAKRGSNINRILLIFSACRSTQVAEGAPLLRE